MATQCHKIIQVHPSFADYHQPTFKQECLQDITEFITSLKLEMTSLSIINTAPLLLSGH